MALPAPSSSRMESGARRGWWVRRQAGRDDAHRGAEAERATGGLSGTEARSHNVQNRAGVRGGEPRRAVEQQDRAQGRVIEPQRRAVGTRSKVGVQLTSPTSSQQEVRGRRASYDTLPQASQVVVCQDSSRGEESRDERIPARRRSPPKSLPRIHTHSCRAAGPPRTAGVRLGRPGRLLMSMRKRSELPSSRAAAPRNDAPERVQRGRTEGAAVQARR